MPLLSLNHKQSLYLRDDAMLHRKMEFVVQKFHYDVDLGNFTGDWCEILADSIDNPNWLNEFYRGLEEDLREREYIR